MVLIVAENLYSTGQKQLSKDGRENWDRIFGGGKMEKAPEGISDETFFSVLVTAVKKLDEQKVPTKGRFVRYINADGKLVELKI